MQNRIKDHIKKLENEIDWINELYQKHNKTNDSYINIIKDLYRQYQIDLLDEIDQQCIFYKLIKEFQMNSDSLSEDILKYEAYEILDNFNIAKKFIHKESFLKEC